MGGIDSCIYLIESYVKDGLEIFYELKPKYDDDGVQQGFWYDLYIYKPNTETPWINDFHETLTDALYSAKFWLLEYMWNGDKHDEEH